MASLRRYPDTSRERPSRSALPPPVAHPGRARARGARARCGLWLLLSAAPLGALAASPLKAYTGEQATFVLPTLAGVAYELADHAGEVVLVNFWATWCPPCIEEMPSMERLAERLAAEPFALVTINMGEERDAVAAFVEALDLGLTVLIDADGTVTRDWGVFAFPSTFLVGPDGRITHARYGEADWNDPEIVSIIESALP